MMTPGETFNKYGSAWLVLESVHESNQRFEWDTVQAKWTGFGPAPMWPKEPRQFHMNRRPLSC